MYIRTTIRKNKDGSVTEYLQLAHNEWDKKSKRSIVKVLLNFGRKDELDKKGLERLIVSIQKVLGTLPIETSNIHDDSIQILSTRTLGGCWFLDQLWNRLEIGDCLKRLLVSSGYEIPVERALFAMVANRAIDPASKLSTQHWVNEEAYIPSLSCVSVHQLYRSMDFLLEHSTQIQEDIFFSIANLLNLEVDLIYFDTTSTYFETDSPDETDDTETQNENALRQYGYSKDKRADLPQIIIGIAVTKEGIPVRCWVFSGETADMAIVEQVKKDLNGWRLGRVVSVMDCGFSSEENCIKLQSGGGHYIIGEKMRSGKPDVEAALAKKGRYTKIKEHLYAKETLVGEGERRKRYVVLLNHKEAEKDKITRESHLQTITAQLTALGDLTDKAHTKAVCDLVSHRTYGRYLTTCKDGRLVLNKAKIAAEEKLDGKYLIKTSDDTLSIQDIVLGYKQLYDVERCFRTIKTELELRPVYHRNSQRIKAHVLICWLALLLIRIAENETNNTWFHLRRTLKKLNLVELKLSEGVFHQITALTAEHTALFSVCRIKAPPKIIDMRPS